jgi:hypothetical protein
MSYTKNAAAFGKLVGICAGYEATYRPARQNLTIPAIRNMAAEAGEINRLAEAANQQWITATGSRKVAFDNLRETLKRLRGAVMNLDTDDGTKKLLRSSITRAAASTKRTNPPPATENAKVKKHSAGLDFTTRVKHFENVVNTLAVSHDYQSSVPELTIESLRKMAAELHAYNEAASVSFTALNAARNRRKQFYTDPEKGLYVTAEKVRNEFKSIYGNPSEQLKMISSVRF